MAIRGSLREASFPDVLQLLALGRKTGCLSVVDGTKFGSVFFEAGKITFAALVNRKDRLGDSLVKRGYVTQEQLEDALRVQRSEPGRLLGEALISAGYVSAEVVHQELRALVEEAVYALFTWTQGAFTFEPDVHPDGRQLTVAINPESLLLEGARRVDEWSLVQRRFPSFSVVFDLDRTRGPLPADLPADQREIAGQLDGRRNLATVIERSGMSDFVAGRALYELATMGWLVQVGDAATAGATEPDDDESPADASRRLGIAYVRAGVLDDAMREFKRVLESQPNDPVARHHLGLISLKRARWDDAVGWLEPLAQRDDASAVMLHHLALAYEGVGRELDAARMLDRASRLPGATHPRLELSRALHAFQLGDYARADQYLQSARARFAGDGPPAVWFHYASLVAAARDDGERAQALLEEGIRTHPSVGVLHSNYAGLLTARGQFQAAAAAVERGMLHAANLAPFQKTVGDLAYRVARYDEALNAYLRAVRLEPTLGPDVYLKLGELRFQRGDVAEAERLWHRALELDPGNRQARANLDALTQPS